MITNRFRQAFGTHVTFASLNEANEVAMPDKDALEGEEEGIELEKNQLLRRIVYLQKMTNPPKPGSEIIVILRNGTYDIAKMIEEKSGGYYNRKNIRVWPKYWMEFPKLPTTVKTAERA